MCPGYIIKPHTSPYFLPCSLHTCYNAYHFHSICGFPPVTFPILPGAAQFIGAVMILWGGKCFHILRPSEIDSENAKTGSNRTFQVLLITHLAQIESPNFHGPLL